MLPYKKKIFDAVKELKDEKLVSWKC